MIDTFNKTQGTSKSLTKWTREGEALYSVAWYLVKKIRLKGSIAIMQRFYCNDSKMTELEMIDKKNHLQHM